MRTRCLAALFALIFLSTVAAETVAAETAAAETPVKAAAAALDAIRGEKLEALRLLAGRAEPDPWLVARELCAQKEFEAARSFALAAPRADTSGLGKQIDGWEKDPAAPTIMDGAMNAATAAADASADQHGAAAKAAARIGWFRRAADEYRACAAAHSQADAAGDALTAAKAWLAMELQRGERARLSLVLLDAGRYAHDAKRDAEAEDLLRRALRQAQRLRSNSKSEGDSSLRRVALAEATLARTLARRGATQDARAYLRRAHKTLTHLADNSALLFVIRELVTVDRAADGLAAGIARAGEMLALARKTKVPAAEAKALELLASMERERKALAIAVAHYEEAEAIYRATKEGSGIARVSLERGVLLTVMGRPTAAKTALNTALEFATSDGVRARAHAGLGEVALDQGDTAEAEKQLARAAAQSDDPKLLARTLAQKGRLQLRMGKTAIAFETLKNALAAMSHANLPRESLHAKLDQGEAARRLKKYDFAAGIVDQTLAESRRWNDATARARTAALDAKLHLGREKAEDLIDRVRKGVRESINMLEASGAAATLGFDRSIDRLLQVGTDAAIIANDPRILLDAGEYGRSRRMVRRLGGRAPLMRALTPIELASGLATLADRREKAVAVYQEHRAKLRRDEMLKARAEVLAVDAEIAKLEKRRESALEPARWLLSPFRIDADGLTAALGAQETLLYFCVGTQRVAVLKLTRAGSSIIDLGDRKALEDAVRTFRTGLQGDAPEAAIAAIRPLVFVPLGIANGRELVIVPAAPFGDVAFCAIAPEHTVRMVTSAAEFVRLAKQSTAMGTGILGVGGPDFGAGEQRIRLVKLRNGVPLRKLETSAKLVEEIGDVTLVADRATEQGLRNALRQRDRWKAIHFSVPGLLDAHAPWRSSLALAADKNQDGFLTGSDLIHLGLPAELTVLAACEPAKGTDDVDPAIHGMVEAIHLAGSSRVLLSRWIVDDAATTTLLSHFYSYWKDGKTPAPMALRRAQERVRQRTGMGHPKHWAGWELWGAR